MKITQDQACKILEITGTFTLIELKKHYRKACSKYHPDRNPKGLEMMKLVNVAYALLKKNPCYQKPNARDDSWRQTYRNEDQWEEFTKKHAGAQDNSSGRGRGWGSYYYYADAQKEWDEAAKRAQEKEKEQSNFILTSVIFDGTNAYDIICMINNYSRSSNNCTVGKPRQSGCTSFYCDKVYDVFIGDEIYFNDSWNIYDDIFKIRKPKEYSPSSDTSKAFDLLFDGTNASWIANYLISIGFYKHVNIEISPIHMRAENVACFTGYHSPLAYNKIYLYPGDRFVSTNATNFKVIGKGCIG